MTQLAWYDKIITWIPNHFTGQQYDAYFQAMGGLLDDMQVNVDQLLKETYISTANTPYKPPIPVRDSYQDLSFLDIHAQERGLTRLSFAKAEADQALQERIRRLKFTRTKENIKENIKDFVGAVDLEIVYDYDASFLSGTADKRSDFIGNISQSNKATAKQVTIGNTVYALYGPLDWHKRVNCFSVLLDLEKREPHSYFDNDAFYDNRAFYSERERTIDDSSVATLINLIKQKAPAGAGFRLLVKGDNFTGEVPKTITAQEELLNG